MSKLKTVLGVMFFPYHRLVWRELQTGRTKRAFIQISISHLVMALAAYFYYKRVEEIENSIEPRYSFAPVHTEDMYDPELQRLLDGR